MKYLSKPHEVAAFRFAGTEASAIDAEAFVSAHDIENAEVTWQGDEGALALDVQQTGRIWTIESGDYLFIRDGSLYAETGPNFERYYEAKND